MTDIIEAGARAIYKYEFQHSTEAGTPYENNREWIKEMCRDHARAAYVAMVGAMTAGQCKGIRYSMKCEIPVEFRAALLKLVEVDDAND